MVKITASGHNLGKAAAIVLILVNIAVPVLAFNPFTAGEDEEGIPAPVLTGVRAVHNPDRVLEGSPTGAQLIKNIGFTDVRDHWSSRYVYSMAARSIIRGYGSSRFSPESPVTRQEVIALLLRAMGREEDVQRLSEARGTGIRGDGVMDLWAGGYVELAGRLGIADVQQNADWKAPATRQEVAVWFARALGLQPVYGSRQQYVYTFRDWKAFQLENIPYIEAVLQEGIMKGDGSGYFRPSSGIKRGEVAAMLYGVAGRFGGDTSFGTLEGQLLQVYREGNGTSLGMLDTGGNLVSIRLQGGETFPVFREGMLGDHTLLKTGDGIILTVNNGEVVYCEVDGSGSVHREILQSAAASPGWKTYLGTVIKVLTREEWNGAGYSARRYYRVMNIDGSLYDIAPDPAEGDIPVYIDGKISGTGSLREGDSIQYGVRNGSVYYITVVESDSQLVRGYFRDIQGQFLTLYDYSGTLKKLPLWDSAKVIINQRDALLSDLKYGQEVEVKTRLGRVSEITALDAYIRPGYLPPGSRVREGTIARMEDNTVEITTPAGNREEYRVSAYTSVYRGGCRSRLSSIKPGDRVKVYLDDPQSAVVSRIDISGGSHIVKYIARGELDRVSLSGGELYIGNFSVLEDGEWKDKDYRAAIRIDGDTKIYYRGREISPDSLQREHRGDLLYLAVTDWFGSLRAVKAVVKDGYQAVYKDTVEEISWGAGQLELRNGRNIQVNEGTIIVANNRLVDLYNIEEDISVEAVVENTGDLKNALVLVVQDVLIGEPEIYVGRFNEVRTDEFDINYYSILEDNGWDDLEGSSDIETFYYDDDTVIVDVTDGCSTISPREFFRGDYADDHDTRRNYDYYGFVIAREGRASFVRLSKGGIVQGEDRLYDDTLQLMRITAGDVAAVDPSTGTVELKNARNWSTYYEDWEPADSRVYINYSKALIIRDGRAVEGEDLLEGETLYIIRDDNRGLIILVQ